MCNSHCRPRATYLTHHLIQLTPHTTDVRPIPHTSSHLTSPGPHTTHHSSQPLQSAQHTTSHTTHHTPELQSKYKPCTPLSDLTSYRLNSPHPPLAIYHTSHPVQIAHLTTYHTSLSLQITDLAPAPHFSHHTTHTAHHTPRPRKGSTPHTPQTLLSTACMNRFNLYCNAHTKAHTAPPRTT
jgi:hypothetical protein